MSDIKREIRVKQKTLTVYEIEVPGDKSISHRAIMFAALSNGPCEISGFLPSEDCLATMNAMRMLGVTIDELEHDKSKCPTKVLVHGVNGKFTKPEKPIDCGNSGTTMRLLAGILSAQPFTSRLIGDASLSRRPMRRVMEPLEKMGADIRAEGERDCAPLVIRGATLQPIEYELPVASAQVKSAILLAGLFTSGKTTVIEPTPTRDHTERMLEFFLGKVVRDGKKISVYGGHSLESRDYHVPGDISSAAFWLVAAAAMPDVQLTIKNVGLNPTRSGILRVLTRMGAQISDNVVGGEMGEPSGHIVVRGRKLQATAINGDIIPNIIDELPIISVAAALADGTTTIRGAEELRVKETDRISAVAENLEKMGVSVEQFYDGMDIQGGSTLKGARLPSFDDHRIAMSFAIAGLFAEGETIIEGAECIDTSYPGFADDLKKFTSGREKGAKTPTISTVFSRTELRDRKKVVADEKRKAKEDLKLERQHKRSEAKLPDDDDEFDLAN